MIIVLVFSKTLWLMFILSLVFMHKRYLKLSIVHVENAALIEAPGFMQVFHDNGDLYF